MSESTIWWAEKTPEGWIVDIPKLLFEIILTELCAVGILNRDHIDGRRLTQEEHRELWKVKIQNLRKIPKRTVVRAMYHQFYNSRGDTRETYPHRWKTAWEHTNFLFNVDLDRVWDSDYWFTEFCENPAKEEST